jgi:hypothetical protein
LLVTKLLSGRSSQLEPHRSFELSKVVFDSMHWQQLREGRDQSAVQGDVAAVIMDQGIAYVRRDYVCLKAVWRA